MNESDFKTGGLNLDAIHRSLIFIWVAILVSVCLFFLLAKMAVAPRPPSPPEDERTLNMIVWIGLGLGLLNFALSFVFKRKYLARSIIEQKTDWVKTGVILALALCESTCLFGVLIYFIEGPAYASYLYLLLGLSALGILLHMPRRDHLLAASVKSRGGASKR